MAWMKTKIKIDEEYTKKQREAIAFDIIERIVDRTVNDNVDKDGKPFPKYSKSYIKSLDFKIAGKTKKVNLTLSGDMLADMQLLSSKKGEITIGFKNGTDNNAKAEGNIKGSYGKSVGDPKKARDFLGLTKGELDILTEKYPLDDKIALRERVAQISELVAGAEEITAKLVLDEIED